MNYSTAVMLINPNIRAIKTIYEPDTTSKKQQRYIFKTLDHSIEKGDFVVIPTDTRHNMTVVQVDEVDVDIDFEDTMPIKWVISKVSIEENERILFEEGKWIEALKESEKKRKRDEIRKNMLELYADDKIGAMPIANFSDVKALESKVQQ